MGVTDGFSPESIISVDCPLCESKRSDLFDQRNFRGWQVTNRVCLDCGLVFQSPRLSDADLEVFYTQQYRKLYQGYEGPSAKDLAVQRARAASLLAFLQGNLVRVSRHLDIGCSTGLLLQQVRSFYDSEAAGIEPGEAYLRYAREQGLHVFSRLEDLPLTEGERFDLISLAHVLEHLGDPVAYLADLRQTWLAENGFLLVEAPNLYAHDCFEVAHLVSFSQHTLKQVLLMAGFELFALEKHGRPRSQLIPFYLTALARPAVPVEMPAPERWVKIKRQLGMFRRWLLFRLSPRRAWIRLPGEQL